MTDPKQSALKSLDALIAELINEKPPAQRQILMVHAAQWIKTLQEPDEPAKAE